jgi:hypothetical protein
MPAAALAAGDVEDPDRDAAPGEYPDLMSEIADRDSGVFHKTFTLDFDLPRNDSPRTRYVPTTRDIEESRSDLLLEFADVYLGALQDLPPNTPLSSSGSGTPTGSGHQHQSLAEAATNPVAPLIQLQFQNVSGFNNTPAGGYSNVVIVQPVIPFSIGKQQFVTRTTFPLLATTGDLPTALGGRQYGTGDLVFLGLPTWTIKDETWGGFIGAGLAATFPTASNDFLGEGKWQAGPSFVYVNTSIKKVQLGTLVYQQWSYASSGGNNGRPEVSKLFFSVFANYHFDEGWYVSFMGDELWSVDWNDNTQFNMPIALRIGRVFPVFGKQNANVFFQPFYNVTHPDSGGSEWGFKLSFTFLFPQ